VRRSAHLGPRQRDAAVAARRLVGRGNDLPERPGEALAGPGSGQEPGPLGEASIAVVALAGRHAPVELVAEKPCRDPAAR
jgi:hypothetical protein